MWLTCILWPFLLGAAGNGQASDLHSAPLPNRTLRLLVALPPGSTSDVVARQIAERLAELRGHPVIVENRAGASGRIAVDALKRATPDGSTLLLAPIIVPVIAPLVFRNLGYDPVKDLAPVSHVAKYEFAFAVATSHPARDMSEFFAWAQAHPEKANFGTSGSGSLPHFLGTVIERASGTALVHVPYKGVVQLEGDLMGGQIAAGISALSDFVALHGAGRLRILATSGSERSPLLPAVPTFREQGYRSVEAHGWHGVFAPIETPQPVIDQLAAAIVTALQTPDLRSRLSSIGLEPTGTTPKALAAIMIEDTARWRAVIQSLGFAAE